MTDKVIIDYTLCKYYQKGECEAEIDYNGNYCDYTCESDVMNDCYYKQLQRKTQECEKMKEEMKQIKKDLRKRFSVQDVSDGDIIITCSKKQTCYEHLHAYEAMTAYRKADKKRAKYKSALEEIENKIISYCATTCIYGSSCYKECFVLDIIAKAKEQE